MKVNQAQFPVLKMCSLFGVSRSGYYSWINRPKSARAIEDEKLTEDILQFHKDSKETYGAPRIHADLADAGTHIGKKRVARLMKAANIRGVSKKPHTVTTQSDEDAERPKDLVRRKFVAERPNQLWVADITYIPTWAGFIYLAVVLDVFSRKIVGWAIGRRMKTRLVLDALNMAVQQRCPINVIHHSDQGSQYTSIAFGARCVEAGVQPSMGSVGDAYDNAMCESFFSTYEAEVIDRETFKTKIQAEHAAFEFIEGWYNPKRRHSALGMVSPMKYEKNYHAQRLPSGSHKLSTKAG
jgi:putative transposase